MDLFDAVNSGNIARIQSCLREGKSNINALKDGKTALLLAVEKRFFLPTKMLIEAGADVNAQDANGRTPVMNAAVMKDFETVRVLLEAGANPDIQDKWGHTPLYAAADNRDVETIKLILDSGCNLDIQNTEGWTALHKAVYRDHVPSVDLLIQAGANPKIRNKENNLPSEVTTTNEIRNRLEEYVQTYQPGERSVIRREASVRKEKIPTTTADNIARLDKILAKKKAGGNAAEAPAGEAGETWQFIPPLHMLRVKELVTADLRLKDVFDFEARCHTKVAEHLTTGAMSMETREFDDIKDKTLLEKALFQFKEAGGNADPEVIQTGYRTRIKGNLDELRKKGI